MRVLGVDPGTICLGYGVLDDNNGETAAVHYGVITAPKRYSLGERLSFIYRMLEEIVSHYQPGAVAIEQPFVARNVRSAIAIGQAQAIAILSAANAGIPVYEYTPARIKQSVSNYGAGSKEQIQEMVRLLLRLPETPQPTDAADALAVALCHLSDVRLGNLMAGQTRKGSKR
ncbi:MAG: crossover junction endodeoxyribonuclease RuvC [Chloroflexi bacterium]|nr:crossover junction endodeoxyribonuclease RuvC [Chloroflexota bacterium]